MHCCRNWRRDLPARNPQTVDNLLVYAFAWIWSLQGTKATEEGEFGELFEKYLDELKQKHSDQLESMIQDDCLSSHWITVNVKLATSSSIAICLMPTKCRSSWTITLVHSKSMTKTGLVGWITFISAACLLRVKSKIWCEYFWMSNI